jgi:hypothetical protein
MKRNVEYATHRADDDTTERLSHTQRVAIAAIAMTIPAI